jgi:hypothetical protein
MIQAQTKRRESNPRGSLALPVAKFESGHPGVCLGDTFRSFPDDDYEQLTAEQMLTRFTRG